MRCDRRLLSAYRDGELADQQRRDVDEHLGGCAECTTALRGYLRLAQTIRSLPSQQAPLSLERDVRQRILERETVRLGDGLFGGLVRAMTPAAAVAAVAVTAMIVFRPGAVEAPARPPIVAAPPTQAVAAFEAVPTAQAAPTAQTAQTAQTAPTAEAAPAAPPTLGVPPDQLAVAKPRPGFDDPAVVSPSSKPSAGLDRVGEPREPAVEVPIADRLAGAPASIARLYRSSRLLRTQLGSPAPGSKTVTLLEQSFQGGLAVRRSDTREIYVLNRAGGTWSSYSDSALSSAPIGIPVARPGALVPPPGALAPGGGFGNLWRSKPEVQTRLGWAVYEARGSGGAIQTFERGMIIWSPHGLLYVLADDGTWKTYPDASPL